MNSREGWLKKQGGRFKTWKKRWFTIVGTEIHYYAKERKNEKGSFDIKDATEISIATSKECKRQPSFKVVIPNIRTYFMQAQDNIERETWIETLNQVLKQCRSSNKPAGSSAQSKDANGKTPLISTDDFDYLRVLGRGTYGKVQLVKYKKDGQIYAMKSMNKQILQEHGQVEQSLTERNILLQTRHPFLVSAHYTFQTPEKIFLVLDYVPGGELFNRLKAENKFNEPRMKLYAAEIMLGLGKLHSLGFIFRDLKPENILVDTDGHLKITDFGLVKTNMSSTSTTTTFCGTPEYIAPEMLQQLPYTKAVDWWSFGILMFEMLTGLPPFYDSNTSKMYRMILHENLTFPSYVSPDAQDIITKLLNRHPEQRLGSSERDVEELKEHPFFADYDWDDLLDKKINPEWKPNIQCATDTSNFDHEFTTERAGVSHIDGSGLDPNVQANFAGFTCTEPAPL